MSASAMASTVDSVRAERARLSSFPYKGCNTRIVSLQDLDIPEQATDEEYRSIYARYTQQTTSQDRWSNSFLLRDAIESIKHGIAPPVAFPTETVYGLGADATNEAAVSGIFAAKGRPSDNPLIVHVASTSHLEQVTGTPLPEVYKLVAERFWPGPLTILLPVSPSGNFARNVHPAQSTIGFRIPSSKYARFFIAATDKPIAGPSANSSGKPSPTAARHVIDDLKGKINFILDGGDCEVGVESTVVDGLHDPPLILRPGGVSLKEFRALGKEIGGELGDHWARTTTGYKTHGTHSTSSDMSGNGTLAMPASTGTSASSSQSPTRSGGDVVDSNPSYVEDVNGAPRAPGMKYRHYAPRGRLILFSENAFREGRVKEKLNEIMQGSQSQYCSPEHGEKNHTLRIGVISCHWPSFAGLEDYFSATTSKANFNDITNSKSMGQGPDVKSHSLYADTILIAKTRNLNKDITFYNVELGPQISTLAHSLFGVLRLFDDLNCAYMFAEAVQQCSQTFSLTSSPGFGSETRLANGDYDEDNDRPSIRQARRDLEDAVIDRIEKAAAERVG